MIKILRHMKAYIFALLLLAGLLSPLATGTASASLFEAAKQEACAGAQLSDGPKPCDESAQNGLHTTLERVVDLMSIIVGIMAVIMIIISGIRFVTSAGDSGKITSARNTFIYALVGIVIVAFAQLIVKLILTNIG